MSCNHIPTIVYSSSGSTRKLRCECGKVSEESHDSMGGEKLSSSKDTLHLVNLVPIRRMLRSAKK